MKILFIDTVDPLLKQGLIDLGFSVDEDYRSSREEIMKKLSAYGGIVIRSRFPVDGDFMAKATNLKFIARVGAGMENIDIPYAKSRHIELLNAPEGNRDAVGEHAVGMLLMLFNNLRRADAEVRQGIWRREANRGIEIHGKTVGIIGYGNMGTAFAEKLRGFGCNILVYDKYKKGFGDKWVREVDLEELQSEADIVSLHIPQTPETIGMVNKAFIDAFTKPFYLVNTARGKAVHTADLVDGLKSGKVLGACLDVLEYEKASFENMFSAEEGDKTSRSALPPAFQYLVEAENVVLSPHIAGWSHESNRKMAEVILKKVKTLNLA